MAQQSLRFCEIILFKMGVFNLSNYSKKYSKEFKDKYCKANKDPKIVKWSGELEKI
ncbi:hypothetical protein MOO44_08320 [Nicoliella spurrieriana]|uniref:Uncharacterized protein n=1 Tax=Nicoliella spurrieriana TaxID=2925830 RepID=A0A976RS77_9LACO|nr:hypothetical protein MOO44_08320 [Nicoliella spurrieriana]